MRIYISGGISGIADYMDRFEEAERKLKTFGHTVINPARVNGELPADTSYAEYMKMCICMIDMADAVYMMNGWEKSQGAKYEKHYAEIMGKEVLT